MQRVCAHGLEHRMLDASFFVCAYLRGGGTHCARDRKARASIRDEDMHVRLKQLWVFITRENATLTRLIAIDNNMNKPSEFNIL